MIALALLNRQVTLVPGALESPFKLMADNLKADFTAAKFLGQFPLVGIIDRQPLRGGPRLSFQGKPSIFDRGFNFLELFLEQIEEALFLLRGIPSRKANTVRSLHMNDPSAAFISDAVGPQREKNSAEIGHDAFSLTVKSRFGTFITWCLQLPVAMGHSHQNHIQRLGVCGGRRG